MSRIDRRRFVQLSGAGARRRAPGSRRRFWHRARARLCPGHDRALAALGRFRAGLRSAAQGQDHAGMPEGSRHQADVETINANDIQARITSSIQSGTGPDIFMALEQLAAALCRRASPMSARSPRRSARRRAAFTTSARSSRRSAANGSACRGASAAGSSPTANPGSPRSGSDKFPETWDEYRAAGKKLKAAGHPYRPDRRAHLRRRAGLVVSLSVVVGRQGGRGRRQDRRAQQQGDGRVGEVRRAALEGDDGRGRARLGRYQQQPRLPVGQRSAPPTTAPRSTSRPRRSPIRT